MIGDDDHDEKQKAQADSIRGVRDLQLGKKQPSLINGKSLMDSGK